MRLEVSRYFRWTSRPSSGDVIKNRIIYIRSPKMIPVLFRGGLKCNSWNDNWNRRWKFTNIVHSTPSKILRRHHCRPYRHRHQQQHHFHFSTSSWSLALEPYLRCWEPLDFFLHHRHRRCFGFYEYCKRESIMYFFISHTSNALIHGRSWASIFHQNTVTLGLVSGGSCLLRAMCSRRKRNQLIVLLFIQNVSGFQNMPTSTDIKLLSLFFCTWACKEMFCLVDILKIGVITYRMVFWWSSWSRDDRN